jgi:Tfp pilus assembly protein PilE
MNKKAFTLVELLGTVVILSIILIIAVPSIMDTMRRANINEASAFLTKLYNASESYIEINRQAFDQLKVTNGRVDIPVKYLLDEGLIRELGNDPATMTPITINHTVTATRQADGTIVYGLYNGNTNIESYVTNGLILHLDAINNFGMGHSNTTTVWNDLTTYNSTGNLKNFSFNSTSGWTNNALVFDGVNDYVSGMNLPAIAAADNFTWIGYLYVDSTTTATAIIFGNRHDGVQTPLQFTKLTRDMYSYYVSSNYAPNYVLPTNQWIHVAIVKTGTSFNYYLNGVTVATTALATPNMASNPFNIGGNLNPATGLPAENSKISVRTIQLYNRALSSIEINSNRTLDINRYR